MPKSTQPCVLRCTQPCIRSHPLSEFSHGFSLFSFLQNVPMSLLISKGPGLHFQLHCCFLPYPLAHEHPPTSPVLFQAMNHASDCTVGHCHASMSLFIFCPFPGVLFFSPILSGWWMSACLSKLCKYHTLYFLVVILCLRWSSFLPPGLLIAFCIHLRHLCPLAYCHSVFDLSTN